MGKKSSSINRQAIFSWKKNKFRNKALMMLRRGLEVNFFYIPIAFAGHAGIALASYC